jgi:hypothetical protein
MLPVQKVSESRSVLRANRKQGGALQVRKESRMAAQVKSKEETKADH